MIFQSFNLVKRSSVINNVLAGRVAYHSTITSLLGTFPVEDKMIALEALDKIGILERHLFSDQLESATKSGSCQSAKPKTAYHFSR